MKFRMPTPAPRLAVRAAALAGAAAMLAALPAHGTSETMDKVADVLTVVVLILVPIVGIVVFWMIHVLPEHFAEKRHHPQAKAIQVLCLLSLVFGGLLWPIAWLWAFTRPIAYKMAYGTERHEHWHEAMGEKARAGALHPDELDHLQSELEAMAAKGALPPSLKRLQADLAKLRAAAAAPAAGGNA